MEKFLRELISKKNAEIMELKERSQKSEDLAEVRSIEAQLEKVTAELKDAEAQLEEVTRASVPADAQLRNGVVVNSTGAKSDNEENMEYRKAFMNFILRGTPIPAELRDDANTLTSDVATAIPTQIVNRIVDKMEKVGMILPLITRTSFKGGVEVPTSTTKPVATWVGVGASNVHGEGIGSDKQKMATGSVSFSYYKLRCEVSMSMEVSVMAISAFEAKFVDNVAKAMVKAIEEAIINGTGVSQPKGILAETPVTGQALTDSTFNYSKLVEAESALPAEYESGAKWCMSKKTYGKILGMVDKDGQPIARVTYGIAGKPERTVLGREVVIAPYVAENTAFIFDFEDYILNTIYDMGISKKQDWDTEDMLTKAVMSVDGKVVDKNSLVTLVVTPVESV